MTTVPISTFPSEPAADVPSRSSVTFRTSQPAPPARADTAIMRATGANVILNTPTGSGARADGYEIRRSAVARGIPCITTLSGASAAQRAIRASRSGDVSVIALQELHEGIELPAPERTR